VIEVASIIRHQLRLVHYALMFYTRIPLPSLDSTDQNIQDHASRYFPLIGWLVGAICAGSFLGLNMLFTQEVSVVLAVLIGIYTTGAFHEDGLADTCDGLGGGWDKAQILDIMKDSRVGTYGLVGLGFALMLKVTLLAQLPIEYVALALLVANVVSRWYSVLVMRLMRYVRMDALSKAKPITKHFANKDFLIATSITLPAFCFLLVGDIWLATLTMGLPVLYLCLKLRKWLGGYTGDTLGAVQQVSEIGFYLSLAAILTW
jgi:adenosylcobinamide-GDP ribazoletransferase